MYNTVAMYKTQHGCATCSSTYIRTRDVMHSKGRLKKTRRCNNTPCICAFFTNTTQQDNDYDTGNSLTNYLTTNFSICTVCLYLAYL